MENSLSFNPNTSTDDLIDNNGENENTFRSRDIQGNVLFISDVLSGCMFDKISIKNIIQITIIYIYKCVYNICKSFEKEAFWIFIINIVVP